MGAPSCFLIILPSAFTGKSSGFRGLSSLGIAISLLSSFRTVSAALSTLSMALSKVSRFSPQIPGTLSSISLSPLGPASQSDDHPPKLKPDKTSYFWELQPRFSGAGHASVHQRPSSTVSATPAKMHPASHDAITVKLLSARILHSEANSFSIGTTFAYN